MKPSWTNHHWEVLRSSGWNEGWFSKENHMTQWTPLTPKMWFSWEPNVKSINAPEVHNLEESISYAVVPAVITFQLLSPFCTKLTNLSPYNYVIVVVTLQLYYVHSAFCSGTTMVAITREFGITYLICSFHVPLLQEHFGTTHKKQVRCIPFL